MNHLEEIVRKYALLYLQQRKKAVNAILWKLEQSIGDVIKILSRWAMLAAFMPSLTKEFIIDCPVGDLLDLTNELTHTSNKNYELQIANYVARRQYGNELSRVENDIDNESLSDESIICLYQTYVFIASNGDRVINTKTGIKNIDMVLRKIICILPDRDIIVLKELCQRQTNGLTNYGYHNDEEINELELYKNNWFITMKWFETEITSSSSKDQNSRIINQLGDNDELSAFAVLKILEFMSNGIEQLSITKKVKSLVLPDLDKLGKRLLYQQQITMNESQTAIKMFEIISSLEPSYKENIDWLCLSYCRCNQIDNAFQVLDKVESNYDEINLSCLKAICYLGLNDIESANKELTSGLKNNDEHISLVYFLQHVMLLLEGDTNGLKGFISKGIDLTDSRIFYCLNRDHSIEVKKLIKTYISNELENNQQSISNTELFSLAELSANLLPNGEFEDVALLARLKYLQGNQTEAQNILINYIRNTTNPAVAMVMLACLRLKMGAYLAASEDFQSLYNAFGLPKLSQCMTSLAHKDRIELARVLRQQALAHMKSRNHTTAINLLSVAIAAIGTASGPGLTLCRGLCLAHINQYVNALDDINSVLLHFPNNQLALCSQFFFSIAMGTKLEILATDACNLWCHHQSSFRDVLSKLPLFCSETFYASLFDMCERYLRVRTNEDDLGTGSSRCNQELPILCHILYSLNPDICNARLYAESLLHHEISNQVVNMINELNGCHKNDTAISIYHAIGLSRLHRYSEAIDTLTEVVKENEAKTVAIVKRHLTRDLRMEIRKKAVKSSETAIETRQYDLTIRLQSVAICCNSVDNQDLIRKRMECYEQVGDHERALTDLNHLIRISPLVNDLCARAKYYHSIGECHLAASDYLYSFELSDTETLDYLTEHDDMDLALNIIVTVATTSFKSHDYSFVQRLCKYGLDLDQGNSALKRLKRKSLIKQKYCIQQ